MKIDLKESEEKLIFLNKELLVNKQLYSDKNNDLAILYKAKSIEFRDYFFQFNIENLLDNFEVYVTAYNIYISEEPTKNYLLNIVRTDINKLEIKVNNSDHNTKSLAIIGLFHKIIKNNIHYKWIIEQINICHTISSEINELNKKIFRISDDIGKLEKEIASYNFFKNVKAGYSYDLKEELSKSQFYFIRENKMSKYKQIDSNGNVRLNIKIIKFDDDFIEFVYNDKLEDIHKKKKINIYKRLNDDYVLNLNSVRKTKLKSLDEV